jgi:hypothetical protein
MKRPYPVTVIAALLIVAGAVSLVFHWSRFKMAEPFNYDIVEISAAAASILLCGIFMLRGDNWTRYFAVLWMAFHVVVGAFYSWNISAAHAVLLVVFGYFLFRSEATMYVRPS